MRRRSYGFIKELAGHVFGHCCLGGVRGTTHIKEDEFSDSMSHPGATVPWLIVDGVELGLPASRFVRLCTNPSAVVLVLLTPAEPS